MKSTTDWFLYFLPSIKHSSSSFCIKLTVITTLIFKFIIEVILIEKYFQGSIINYRHLTNLNVFPQGQLLSDGVRNVTALGNISMWQKIEYDFNFHSVEFLTDIPVLILSERKSMIACDAHLPLRLDADQTFNPSILFHRLENCASLLKKIRNYLTVIRLADFSLGDSMIEAVQKDFIESRAPGREKPMSTEDFHLLLVLSRLLALSYGQKELTDIIWQQAKSMEMERKTRLAAPIS